MVSMFRQYMAALALAASLGLPLGAGPTQAQSMFSPAITVNDQAITRYELEQRARMLAVFNAPGDPLELAREQLIEDRLKLAAAREVGLEIEEADLRQEMTSFAQRGNRDLDAFLGLLNSEGVSEETFRDFVRSGVTWRELVRGRFGPRVQDVSDFDRERAKMASAREPSVEVSVAEIILPAPPQYAQEAQALADELSRIQGAGAFADAARQYSAAGTAEQGGQLGWMALSNLPPALQQIIMGLSPGEVSDPLPTQGAIGLFQLRDIREGAVPAPRYASIEYATYYIAGGRSEEARARAARIKADADRCDDLYGLAKGQPPRVLQIQDRPVAQIPQDVAYELAKLDPGEISYNLTRNGGQTLALVMLCGRTPATEGDAPTAEDLTNFVRNARLESYAKNYLAKLRAEARIVQ